MEFEWDSAKRDKNLERHGIDFLDAELVFNGPVIVVEAKIVAGERRLMATGLLDDVYVTAIYTMPSDIIRIISLRRARHAERREHQDLHSR